MEEGIEGNLATLIQPIERGLVVWRRDSLPVNEKASNPTLFRNEVFSSPPTGSSSK